ncbi:hypothetical protein HK100_001175 [Physocladia obscura]|uniref:Transcription factor domain-containing protein n=1 Tax=Physocladia obscura TaxID=109957 RepID=A0AAD5XB83_9FUNG|nr:hypothetical protein HK100_001175 [Physocladia obscura]
MAYFEKAKKSLVRAEIQSLRVVQALHLLAAFTFVKGQPIHGSIALTQTAQLSLHLKLEVDPDDSPWLQSLTEEEKDERRLVYWILYYTFKMIQLQTSSAFGFPDNFKSNTVKSHRSLPNQEFQSKTASVYHLCKLLDIMEQVLKHARKIPDSIELILSNNFHEDLLKTLAQWYTQVPRQFILTAENLVNFLASSERYCVLNLSNFYATTICILNRSKLYLTGKLKKATLSPSDFSNLFIAVKASLEMAHKIAQLCIQLIRFTPSVTNSESYTEIEAILTGGFWKQAIGLGITCFEAAAVLWYYYCRTDEVFSRYYISRAKTSEAKTREWIRQDMESLKSSLYLLETSLEFNILSIQTRASKPNRISPLLDCMEGMITEMVKVDAGGKLKLDQSNSEVNSILLEMQTLSLEDDSNSIPVADAQDPRVFLGLLGMDVDGHIKWRGRYEESWRQFWMTK